MLVQPNVEQESVDDGVTKQEVRQTYVNSQKCQSLHHAQL